MTMLNRAETGIENIRFENIDADDTPFIELATSDIQRCGECTLCDKRRMRCTYPNYLQRNRGEITTRSAMDLLFDMKMPTDKRVTHFACPGGVCASHYCAS